MLTIEPVRLSRVRLSGGIEKLSKNNKNITFGKKEALTFPNTQQLTQTHGYVLASDKTRLGANYNQNSNAVDFKLASENAQDVFLCIFDKAKDEDEKFIIPMQKKENSNIWEASIPYEKLENKPFYYGYRIFGENWQYSEDFFDENGKIKNPQAGFQAIVDEKGNRFNPNKIAHDPYSRELSHLPASERENDLKYFSSNLFENSAKYAPKSVFSITENEIIPKAKPRTLLDEVIGEVHMKDLTINENIKGAGGYLGAKNFAKKIKQSGISMVEFLPLCEFDNNSNGNNHWGYMTMGFFAPSKRYAHDKSAGGALKEFREMIKAFHDEDIKVCMDVVYNHTGEAGLKQDNIKDARQFSFSLIDNQMYYKQKNGVYNSNSGCGNDMNVANKETMEFIADSVAYWASQGVDAFRFDLAVGLMDTEETEKVSYNTNESLIGKLSKMLKERGVEVSAPDECGGIYLIAEPWTCGGKNSYQLGKFPKNWAQWNDVARETIKNDSLNPNYITPRTLRHVLEGSHHILGQEDTALNYAYSHDGHTLFDANISNDKTKQLMAIKKQIALTLLAKGTPMLQIGDIIGHSKKRNHNSYNQDNEINYLNFAKAKNLSSQEGKIYDFSKKMIYFRKNHTSLKSSIYNEDITYYKPDGSIAQIWDNAYWDNGHTNILSYKINSPNSLFISTSSDDSQINVKIPEAKNGKKWHLVCDTSNENSFEEKEIKGDVFFQKPHSLIILEEK